MSFKTLNHKPMSDLIINHLSKGNSISSVEASAQWRCRDLPKRISELRAEGFDIVGTPRTDSMGQRYNRYQLRIHMEPDTGRRTVPQPAPAPATQAMAQQEQQFQNWYFR